MTNFNKLKAFTFFLITILFVTKSFAQNTTLNVFVADKKAINSDIFGVNNDWKFITDANFPTYASACTNLNLGVLRYPGGWESEWINWDTNTATAWPDNPDTPGASIETVKSNYSNYSVVVPTRTAMNWAYNSANWVYAVNSLKTVAKGAIDKAGAENIKYVEIGNEWWLQNAGGVSRSEKLYNYSKIADEIAAYLVEQFPSRTFNILINGDFTIPAEFEIMKDYFTKSYNQIDGIALHTYTGYNPPADKIDFAIQTLGSKIDACAKNFNQNKDLIIYNSEWMAARDYNESRVYMEAANIIPDVIHIYARHGVDAAAYWPPINSTAPGVGMFNWNASVIYPCGQIMSEMASSYKGEAVKTTTDSEITIVGALNDVQNLVLYVMGKDNPSTQVNINVNNFNISNVVKVTKLRPDDYSTTDKAAPYKTENASVTLNSATALSFGINKTGTYEIYKIELKGEYIEAEATSLLDFETSVDAITDFGASYERVENPDKDNLNITENCARIGRTSSEWYELVDLPCDFFIPANETHYVHVFVKYPANPDVILRLNQTDNDANVRALNSYSNTNQWQDLVFEYSGGESGIQVNYLRFMADCGFENDPSGFVLDNTSNFAYVDEIILSQDATPRNAPTSIDKFTKEADYLLYSKNKIIHFSTKNGKKASVGIYNINGSLIKKYNEATFNCQISVSGVYIIRIDNQARKIIIQ